MFRVLVVASSLLVLGAVGRADDPKKDADTHLGT